MKYSLLANDKVHDETYDLYKKVFKKLKIEESKDPWNDYDILIYLKRSLLNFGEYDQFHEYYNIKPSYKKIQNNQGAYIGRLPYSYFVRDKTFFDYNHFSFYPYSFHIDHKKDLNIKHLDKYKYWIIKPSLGTRGDNIIISKNKDVINHIEKYNDKLFPLAIQRYIDNPLLLNGYKFDFRVYVLYIDNHLYINKYYHVRIASKLYDYNNPTDRLAGLTNFSLHKNLDLFWSKDRFLKEYEDKYPKNSANFLNNKLMNKFIDIIRDVFKYINKKVKTDFWEDKENHYFNLFGFDFLPDETGKLYLIEINPSIGLADVKKNSQAEKVVTDMIKMIMKKKQSSFILIDMDK